MNLFWSIVIVVIIILVLWYIFREPNKSLPVAKFVDLNRYQGTWYEIARLPNWFQEGCKKTTANYQLNKNGTVKVVNTCIRNGEINKSEGIAYPNDSKIIPGTSVLTPGKLKVSFFGSTIRNIIKNLESLGVPSDYLYGDYNILYVSPDYQYALVGTEDRENFWILKRNRTIDKDMLNKLIKKGRDLGYPVQNLIFN